MFLNVEQCVMSQVHAILPVSWLVGWSWLNITFVDILAIK